MSDTPLFGQADLTSCDREPIHLAGAVQPQGFLLALREADAPIVQASRNAAAVLGRDEGSLAGRRLAELGGDLADRVAHLARHADLRTPVALQACAGGSGAAARWFEGALHRNAGGLLILELEPHEATAPGAVSLPPDVLATAISTAVQRFSAAPSIGTLADAVVQTFRELTGYDRVMVYRFDPDGHGRVVAESCHPRLEPLLGHHYPASDIPRQARALYLKNRMRALADVDDVVSPLEPALAEPIDLSQSTLRAMSPIHLQYLRNMGVVASFSASLVREGQLWGLVAAHHHSRRYLRWPVRAAAELLAEVASTRITAIENYAHAQVALMVRRLEQRLVEATSTEGDWRYAIFRQPRTLLQPLEATGVVLAHDGEVLTAGEVPSSPELRALLDWVRTQDDEPFACNAVAKANPALASLAPVASGVLAVRLSSSRADHLLWLRKEQLQTVTWAGNPTKPMTSDGLETLSPRRSFAAWSEIVRGTAVPWSTTEVALARAIGVALVDIIVQVQAVRLLIAEHQLGRVRGAVAGAREPVLVADMDGQVIFANEALCTLAGRPVARGDAVAALFVQQTAVTHTLERLRASPQPWRQEFDLHSAEGPAPVGLRAEVVTGRDGLKLGLLIVLADLRETRRANAARAHLEDALRQAAQAGQREADEVTTAILTNASLAAMDIAEARGGPPVTPLLQEVEASTRRAAALYAQIRSFSG